MTLIKKKKITLIPGVLFYFCYNYFIKSRQLKRKIMLFSDLSDTLQEKLRWIKDVQLEGFYDPRGSYCEFDSDNCKPWHSDTMVEAQDCPWLEFHSDSDDAHELAEPYMEEMEAEDEDEEPWEEEITDSSCGVAFITIKAEFLDLITDE